ncbi:MAG TPA: tetratricopeptide repeat protein, partial [Magnetospirillaceae bacterium]|nr:tetratricopeptide repeat protein [Magnetospirillaceae bacterium]
ELLFALGEALYRDNRPDLAQGWFDRTAEADPDHELAALYRVSCRESLSDAEGALSAYADYIGRWPDNTSMRREYVRLLMSGRRFAEAARAIEGGMPYAGSTGAADHAALAVCYRNTERYREAGALHRSLLRADPGSVEHLLGLALCLQKTGSFAAAVELLEKGAPYVQAAGPWSALGILYARRGRSESALIAFRKAAELAPDDPKPLRNMARIYERTGLKDLARRYVADAERLTRKADGQGSFTNAGR